MKLFSRPGVLKGMSGTLNSSVMVVDDEPMIRQLVSSVLSSSGYSVVNAESSAHAVELMETGHGLDLLVTDVIMPGMNGCDLATSMVARKPGLRVLFMSAYEPGIVAAANIPGSSFLRKPFRIAELLERVRQLLTA